MAGRTPLVRAEGFTLLEILVAIAIFAISVSIVYGLYASIVSVVHNVEDTTALNNQSRVALERLTVDLEGIFRGKQGYLKGSAAQDDSDEPFLEFVSTSHLSFEPEQPAVPLALMRYYLEQADDETYLLRRSDTSMRPGADTEALTESRKLTLCQGLQRILVTYLDREGQEFEEWDSQSGSEEEQKEDTRFPAALTIELVFPGITGDEDDGQHYTTTVWLRPGLITFEEQ